MARPVPVYTALHGTPQRQKTKAKKRYLKAKQERRKKRKALAPEVKTPTEAREQSPHVHYDSESELSESEEVPGGDGVPEGSSRPRKRRKFDIEDAAALSGSHPEKDQVVAEPSHITLDDSRMRSPTPPAALPVFPQPRRPEAPSKLALALQGLDKTLTEAMIVNPATTLPIETYCSEGPFSARAGLGSKMEKRLKDLGITELFAVQTAVIPLLLSSARSKSLYRPYDPPQDLCVSAPTGSGKTLAYVVPIVEVLSTRVITRLRALVVLPTRDLVGQVRETFEAVAAGRGLKIGIATGQHSFSHEQAQLVAECSTELQGGSSKVDILICTPGRLIDHLNGTSNFSLQHLRFLVIDEADRLLAQSFQDWLAQVLKTTRPSRLGHAHHSDAKFPAVQGGIIRSYPDALSPAFLHILTKVPSVRTDIDENKDSSCQKMLFSATLTRDPAQIAALGLHDPKYIVVQSPKTTAGSEDDVLDFVMEKFTVPATLIENMIVCEASVKPLMLFHLVHARDVTNALVFTKSADSTTRLVRLFEFFEKAYGNSQENSVVARAYSSDLAPGERKSILEQFKNQKIHMLVCSDLISRGIDISHVSHVVSYDVPVDFRKYVHRVGRTARAGRTGIAWTLVEEQEARYFKMMLKQADHLVKVKRVRVADGDVESMKAAYESALSCLKEVYLSGPSIG